MLKLPLQLASICYSYSQNSRYAYGTIVQGWAAAHIISFEKKLLPAEDSRVEM